MAQRTRTKETLKPTTDISSMRSVICSFIPPALLLVGCGYSKIYSSEHHALLTKDEYLNRIEQLDNEIIIDVRTPVEYSRGHIPNAINISFLGFSFEERAMDLDTNRPIFIYCETAHRSPYAMRKLKRLGFKKIYDLKKGYSCLRE